MRLFWKHDFLIQCQFSNFFLWADFEYFFPIGIDPPQHFDIGVPDPKDGANTHGPHHSNQHNKRTDGNLNNLEHKIDTEYIIRGLSGLAYNGTISSNK